MDTTDKVWVFIGRYMKEHGYSPSHREMMEAVHISSTSVVAYHLDKLADRGIITKGPQGTMRTLRLNKEYD